MRDIPVASINKNHENRSTQGGIIYVDANRQAAMKAQIKLFYEGKIHFSTTRPKYEKLSGEISKGPVTVESRFLAELFGKKIEPDIVRSCRYSLFHATEIFLDNFELELTGEIQSRNMVKNDSGEGLKLNYQKIKKVLIETHSTEIESRMEDLTIRDIPYLEIIHQERNVAGSLNTDFLRNIFKLNRGIIKGLKLVSDVDEPFLCGFFVIYPITKTCAQLIESGRIVQSRFFKDMYICNLKDAAAIYISWVIAITTKESKGILPYLKGEIANILREYPNIDRLYMRPGEDDGVRLAKAYGFTPVRPDNGERSISLAHSRNILAKK